MPKIDFLDPQEAEKINKEKWKKFWWTPCNNKTKPIFIGNDTNETGVLVLICQLQANYLSLVEPHLNPSLLLFDWKMNENPRTKLY